MMGSRDGRVGHMVAARLSGAAAVVCNTETAVGSSQSRLTKDVMTMNKSSMNGQLQPNKSHILVG